MKQLTFIATLVLLYFLTSTFSLPTAEVSHSVPHRVVTTTSAMIEEKELLPLPTTYALAEVPSDEEWSIIKTLKNAHLVAHIYKHESTFGRADVCRSKGKFNGFGYNEWKGHSPTCYQSFSEVAHLVDTWIEDKKEKGYSLAMINCLYVRGLLVSRCQTAYKLE